MSDVRTLLKAKRQEIRIEHPLASYTSGGQLRCIVCETSVKHPSAWDGHLGSKAHRTNAARVREAERRQKELEEGEEAKRFKRKMTEDDDMNDGSRSATKKSKVSSASQPSTSGLPPDFFSDPSRVPLSLPDDTDDEDEVAETTAAPVQPTNEGGDSSLDTEWMQFQRSVIDAPDAITTYDHATVVAEPELVSDPSKGLPMHDDTHAQPLAKVDEEERRRREREERELIMDRLMDEERAQEEADMRVTVMKNKLDALRKRREIFRSAKSNVFPSPRMKKFSAIGWGELNEQ